MARKQIALGFSLCCLASLLEVVLAVTHPLVAEAQAFRPPDRGAPTATAGGASRSTCLSDQQSLKALVPQSKLGLTLAARPTFFVYVPQTQIRAGEFVLKDGADKDVYRMPVSLTGNPGILSLQLPETAPALNVGKDYRWYFSLICRADDRLEDAFVSAWVQRVSPSPKLQQAIKMGTLRTLPSIYANAGIWHETMASLVNLRRQHESDLTLKADWIKLMTSVELNELISSPLVSMPVATTAHN